MTSDEYKEYISLDDAGKDNFHVSTKAIENMNNDMIAKWNARVSDKDTVYHLGDFTFRNLGLILPRLKGKIEFVKGNHDKALMESDYRNMLPDIREVKVFDKTFVLCHYAMRIWHKRHYGTLHLYGHSHGNLPDDPSSLSFDVGVDCHNMTPLSFDEVMAIMAKKQNVKIDHH